jgi:hypothetical protein
MELNPFNGENRTVEIPESLQLGRSDSVMSSATAATEVVEQNEEPEGGGDNPGEQPDAEGAGKRRRVKSHKKKSHKKTHTKKHHKKSHSKKRKTPRRKHSKTHRRSRK